MAILKIARMGHPVLRAAAREVVDPSEPRVLQLVDDMLETMIDADGTGLAAPQVHVPLRVVIFQVVAERDEDEGAEVPLTVLVNPVFEQLDTELVYDWEACLSVPGLTGLVPRCRKIRYRGVTPDGMEVDRVAEGFHARVVQHECDHLDGFLFPQRMDDMSLLVFRDELRNGIPDAARLLMEISDAE
ncbi:MAG: peptide deformylase [Pirellulaceae bacterium]|jgi:peptide deformylase|nr:peptide deformylase [Pirellulaceae bacterium]